MCVHELHGNMQWMICLSCGQKYPVELMTKNIAPDDDVPECEKCGGILKPDVIFFGDALPQKVLMIATHEAQNCDLFIVIGSSLVVYPAAYMPLYAKRAGAPVVILNIGPTEQDDIADVIINASAGETMMAIMKVLKSKG
jgi:NAD-dependent deacetylase